MPTYEYACGKCGTRFDAVQAFNDAPLATCEVCSGPLRRVYGNVGIVFKGSGFYKTDSRTATSGSKSEVAPKAAENGKSEISTSEAAPKPAAANSSTSTDGAKSASPKEPAAKP